MYKLICFYIATVCFIAVYIFFVTVMKYHLLGIEQNSFFAYTPDFYNQFINLPGEMGGYCSAWLCQFYGNVYVGALIHTILLIANFCALFLGLKRITKNHNIDIFRISMLIIILLLYPLCNKYYSLVECLAISFVLTLSISTSFIPEHFRGIFNIIVFCGLYILCGAFAFIFTAFAIAFNLSQKRNITTYIYSGILLLVSLIFPYLSRFGLFYMTNNQAYFASLPYNTHRAELSMKFILTDNFVWLIWGILLLLPFAVMLKIKNSKINSITTVCVVALFGLYTLHNVVNKEQLLFEKTEYYAEKEDYETIWTTCSDYFSNHDVIDGDFYTYALMKMTKLSALMTGRLSEEYTRLLVKPGFNLLFPNSEIDAAGVSFFYSLGLMTYARQYALLYMEGFGMTNRLMRLVAATNIVIEDSLFNKKYDYILSQTPTNKNFVQNLKNNTEYLTTKRALLQKSSFWDPNTTDQVVLSFDDVAYQNKYAFDYCAMFYLLFAHEEDYLIHYIDRFSDLDYKRIPTFFQQAYIVACGYGVGNSDITQETIRTMDFGGFQLEEQIISRYERFLAYANYASAENIMKEYGDTYYAVKFFTEAPALTYQVQSSNHNIQH